jgi:hypothetical protein
MNKPGLLAALYAVAITLGSQISFAVPHLFESRLPRYLSNLDPAPHQSYPQKPNLSGPTNPNAAIETKQKPFPITHAFTLSPLPVHSTTMRPRSFDSLQRAAKPLYTYSRHRPFSRRRNLLRYRTYENTEDQDLRALARKSSPMYPPHETSPSSMDASYYCLQMLPSIPLSSVPRPFWR